jgi:flagellar motor switch protein FliM
MPASFDPTEPEDDIAEPEEFAEETLPQHLAIHASPTIVEHAEQIHQTFLKSLQSNLAATLGCDTKTAFVRTEQAFLTRYLIDADPGVHKVVLSLEPLAGCAILRFSSEVLVRTLDILLASPPEAVTVRSESITDIEFHVLRGFFRVFEDVLKETWLSISDVALTPLPVLSEENLRVYGESHALAMKSSLSIDEVRGEFDVVIPAFLVRLSSERSASAQKEQLPQADRVGKALGLAKVDLDAVLADITIRIADLAELTPGQILLTDKGAASGFDCLVNRRTHFKGEMVSIGDRYGFQLSSSAEETVSPVER